MQISRLAAPAIVLALHTGGGLGALSAVAQSTTTFTTSTTSASGFESPPACSEIGSTRQVVTIAVTPTIGPACIGIGNRDIPNPSPDCGGLPPHDPDPAFGETLQIIAGLRNLNTNTHTLTLTCVAPTPALPWPWLIGWGRACSARGRASSGGAGSDGF